MFRYLIIGITAAFLFSCDNRGEDRVRRFCENEQKLLFPYYQEPWDSTFNINWDLSLSMDEFYQSAVLQVGEDTCVGSRSYGSRLQLQDGNSIHLVTFIGKRDCECCPVDPPGIKASRLIVSIINDSLTTVQYDTLQNKTLEKALSHHAYQMWHLGQDKRLIFELLWSKGISKKTLERHIIAILDSYFNFLSSEFDSIGNDICDSQIDYNQTVFPLLVVEIEGYRKPPPSPPPFPDSIKDSVNLE